MECHSAFDSVLLTDSASLMDLALPKAFERALHSDLV
jgi:hypothetical protein